MSNTKKCAVFVLLGQSNAVGHGIPMKEEDVIREPLKNVFGLARAQNQSFDIDRLTWSGYTSHSMNLAEQQDNTYSVANCLAARWQAHIDSGNAAHLPDLYIIHIAIGAQGVTRRYLWHPETEKILIPGVLGKCRIALFPFSCHIFSLLDKSFAEMGKQYEVIGVHWRGGENDALAGGEELEGVLTDIYHTLFDSFSAYLHKPPFVLHKLVCPDRMNETDATGGNLHRMHIINRVFEQLAAHYAGSWIFDATNAPQFTPNVRGNGLFMQDAVHFTPAVNDWVAEQILSDYINKF